MSIPLALLSRRATRRLATRRGVFLAAVLAVAGCSPSVNPSLKSSVDAQLQSVRTGGLEFSAPTHSAPMPLEVGQWASYKMVDNEGQPSIVTYKLVGEDAGAHWLEHVSESYFSRHVLLMLVELGNRSDLETMQVRAVKQKTDDNAVTQLPEAVLSMMQSLWKPVMQGMVVQWEDKPQQDATVSAGRFAQCFQMDSNVNLLGIEGNSRTWYHPEVPFSGMVRSKSLDDSSTVELLEFGLEGAQSEIGI